MPKPFYPQSLNRFAYAYNNPIRLIDLDGHETGNADGGNFADVDEENEEESAFGGYVREIVQEHYGHWIDAANGKATVEDLGYIVADIVTAGRGKVATSVISKGIKSVKGVGKAVGKTDDIAKTSLNSQKKTGKTSRDRFSKKEREKGFERSKDTAGTPRCEYCGQELDPKSGKPNSYEADHRKSVKEGGPSTSLNLAPSCRSCNRQKGSKQLGTEWIPPNNR